jgi:hypothetical protein
MRIAYAKVKQSRRRGDKESGRTVIASGLTFRACLCLAVEQPSAAWNTPRLFGASKQARPAFLAITSPQALLHRRTPAIQQHIRRCPGRHHAQRAQLSQVAQAGRAARGDDPVGRARANAYRGSIGVIRGQGIVIL